MKVTVVLNIEVSSEEEASMIEDRIASCDFESTWDEVNNVLDEFGEVESVEVESVEAE